MFFLYTFKFSNNDINGFILLLRKGVYQYKNMDDWENFNETTLPWKRILKRLKYARYCRCRLHTWKRWL